MIPACFGQTTRTSYDRNCRQPEVRIGKCTSAAKLYGHKPYYVEKNCDKRFLDRAINLRHTMAYPYLAKLILRSPKKGLKSMS